MRDFSHSLRRGGNALRPTRRRQQTRSRRLGDSAVRAAVEALEDRCMLSVSVTVNTAQTYQTITGFGTSLAPWSPLDTESAFQTMYYQNLGASMLRVQLNPEVLEASPGDMTDPVVLGNNLQDNISKFNFTAPGSDADANGLLAAASNTDKIDQVTIMASIWTPPNWMKGPDPYGGLPAVFNGNTCGGSLIDTPENLQQFGDYVAAYVAGFEQTFGVKIAALSVQNELAFSEPYDSCYYTPQVYVDAVKAVHNAFVQFGINTQLIGPEDVGVGSTSNGYFLGRQMSYINAVEADPVAAADLGIFAIHGYAGDGVTTVRSPAMWANYWSDISGYGLQSWMTEMSGEPQTYAGAMDLAGSIQDALVEGNVSAWVYWFTSQGSTPDTVSLTTGTDTNTPLYNAVKQFSLYIRPGAVRVAATPTNPNGVYVSSFVQTQDQTLTTVLENQGTTDQTISLKVTGVTLAKFSVVDETTASSYGASLAPISVINGVATFDLPAQSILTLQGSTNPAFINDKAPVLVHGPTAALNPANDTQVILSALATGNQGPTNLTYTWSTLGTPPAPVTFSINGSSSSGNSIATLTKAGTYTFQVTVTDEFGLTVVRHVSVTVAQKLSAITVAPATTSVNAGSTQKFTASGRDQFRAPMAKAPSIKWSVQPGGPGSISSAGLYSAPKTASGAATVVASSAGVSGSAALTLVPVPLGIFSASGDIGPVRKAGNSVDPDASYTVSGSGAGIGSTADQFQYLYTVLSGDGMITARITAQGNTNPLAQAGLMFRNDLTTGSAQVSVLETPANGQEFVYRPTAGASSTVITGGASAVPRWLRLVRSGDSFTAYESADGINWVQIGSATISMNQSIYVGLAVSSRTSGLSVCAFDNVSMAPPVTPESMLLATDYFTGSGALQAQTDGTGWNTQSANGSVGWWVQNQSTTVPGYQETSASPLSYQTLVTSGGNATGGSVYLTAGRQLDVGGAFAADEDTATDSIGKPGTTVWMSVLVQDDSASADSVDVGLNNTSIAWDAGTPQQAAGNVEVGDFGGSSPTWSLNVGGAIVSSDKAVVVGQTALLVVELNFTSSGDTASLYVDPTSLGASAPATADVSAGAASLEFRNVTYYAGFAPSMSAIADLRFGSSFAAVTPAAPTTPTALSATPGSALGSVNLTWSDDASGYLLQVSNNSNFSTVSSYALDSSADAFTLTGLNAGSTYYFRLVATNVFGPSAYSNIASSAAA